MGTYVAKGLIKASKDLDQGDLLVGVLQPTPAVAAALQLRKNNEVVKASASQVAACDPNLRVQVKVKRLDLALVVSSSCDIAQGFPVLVAPVTPFKMRRATTPAEEWLEVSAAATGAANPRTFYLPPDSGLGISRAVANLESMFPVQDDYLMRCVAEGNAHRVAGLSGEALRHLQWKIGAMFGRNARDDAAWPAQEDLKLKLEWLRKQAAQYPSTYKEELDELERLLSPSQGETAPEESKTGTSGG